jgi:alpha-L-arabinofuranosidase
MTTTLPVSTTTNFGPAYFVAGKNEGSGSYILKAAVYNVQDPAAADVPFNVHFDGLSSGASASLTVLAAASPEAQNTPGEPEVVQTSVTTLRAGTDGNFVFALSNLSIALLVAKG